MTVKIDAAFDKAIEDGVFPAAELLAAKGGDILFLKSYGAARKDTCFDIASLTKPVATATVAMMLCAEGALKPDDTLYGWLAGARLPRHKSIRVEHLINHLSGLPAWQPYYRSVPLEMIGTPEGKRMLLDECYREEPVAEPGSRTIYSDIGYMVLGEIVEQAAGEPLDSVFAKRISGPLKLNDTFFVRIEGQQIATTSRRTRTSPDQHVPTPKHGLSSERPARKKGEHRRYAPTEDCPWRERVIHGQVHDQNAYALGGVAGHAGLFSTASDMHKFALELSRCYGGKSDWAPHETVREFLSWAGEKPDAELFAGGWNRPSRRNSASGHRFSPNSIGHLGYTGCSLWIDLANDFWIVLLTNRIHPTSTNQKIVSFRPMIHDLVFDELIG